MRSRFAIAALALLASLAAATGAALALDTHNPTGQVDGSATPNGGFGQLAGLAVDQSGGDLYAADLTGAPDSSGAVHRFDSSGTFISQVTGTTTPQGAFSFSDSSDVAVDSSGGTSDGNLYVTDTNNNLVDAFDPLTGSLVAGFGAAGQLDGSTTPIGSFSSPCGLAVDAAGRVYVADSGNNRIWIFGETGAYLDRIADSGALNGPCGLALDSTGDLYVRNSGAANVVKFDRVGPTSFDFQAVVDSNNATDVAVDSADDHVYVDGGSQVTEYDSGGSQVSGFGGGTLSDSRGLAVAAAGSIYAADGGSLHTFGPLVTLPDVTTGDATNIADTTATVVGTVNPLGIALTDCVFEYGPDTSYGQSAPCVPDPGSSTDPVDVSADLSGLDPNTEYHFRVSAANVEGTAQGEDRSFQTSAVPDAITLPAGPVTHDTAVLGGTVDPNGSQTTFYIEYSAQADFSDPVSLPASQDAEAGSGTDPVPASKLAIDLEPATTYFYRVVATNQFGSDQGEAHQLSTLPEPGPEPDCPNAQQRQAQHSTHLPDCRAYEQVSPPDKEDVDLFHGNPAQVSVSGDDLYWMTIGAFAGAQTANFNDYLSARGAASWSTESIDPPTVEVARFHALNGDLSQGVLDSTDIPGAPGATVGGRDFYLRDNATGTYSVITTQPAQTPPFGAALSWASPDLEHVLIVGDDPVEYFPGSPAESAYYANTATGEMNIASVLPDGTFAPSAGPGAGLRSNQAGNRRAVSDDGTRIFFTAPMGVTNKPEGGAQLYVRKDHRTPGAETVHVSAPEAGVIDPNGTQAAFFRGASADGSMAFFTSCEKLTADSTADASAGFNDECFEDLDKEDLYLFDVEANGGDGDLIDLTTTDPSGADVRGFVGASADGSRAYFVATGALAPGALAGQPNLYVWQQGSGLTHVATLGFSDRLVWADPAEIEREARLTPGGEHLAFGSTRQLTAFDNAGHHQVYLYDLAGEELVCASCVGAGPATADASIHSQIPGPLFRGQWFESHNLTDDGGAVVFETGEALVNDDTNGELDVYRYDATSGGAALISTGRADTPSSFVGASPSGHDVFFLTRKRLVGWDQDDLNDIYDARIGGGLPEPPPPEPPCGLDCHGQPSSPPQDPSPGSGSFLGPGNPLAQAPDQATPKKKKNCKRIKNTRKRKKCIRAKKRNRATARRGS